MVSDEEIAVANSFNNGFAVKRIVYDDFGNLYIVGTGNKPVATISKTKVLGFLWEYEKREVDFENPRFDNYPFVVKIKASDIPLFEAWGGSTDKYSSEQNALLDYSPARVANIIARMQKEAGPNKEGILQAIVWPRDRRRAYFDQSLANIANKLGAYYKQHPDVPQKNWYIYGHKFANILYPSEYNYSAMEKRYAIPIPIGAVVKINTILDYKSELITLVEVTGESMANWIPAFDQEIKQLGWPLVNRAEDRMYWVAFADLQMPVMDASIYLPKEDNTLPNPPAPETKIG